MWAFLASQSANPFSFEDVPCSYDMPSANDLSCYATVGDSNYLHPQHNVDDYHQWTDSTGYGQAQTSNIFSLNTHGGTRILNDGVFGPYLPPLPLSDNANLPPSPVSNSRPLPPSHSTSPISSDRNTRKPPVLSTQLQLAPQPTAAAPYQKSSKLRIDPSISTSADIEAASKQGSATSDTKRKRGVGDAVRLSCRHWVARRVCANLISDSDAHRLG
jgi:hypothetical protein